MTDSYAQISVDFEVWQKLVSLMRGPKQDLNEVLRDLLHLGASQTSFLPGEIDLPGIPAPSSALSPTVSGAWFSNVFLPDGTLFRATYKGKTYTGSIKNAQWIDQLGQIRSSPSDAAGAISGTNVNGWRFWYVLRPQDQDWQRMDALKK